MDIPLLRSIAACKRYQMSDWALVMAAGCTGWHPDDSGLKLFKMVKCLLRARKAKEWSQLAYSRVLDGAAQVSALQILELLHASARGTDIRCTTAAMDGAAENGFLDVVKFLHANRTEGCTTAAMDGAAAMGHLVIVRFLDRNRPEGCTTRGMNNAAKNGHLDVVRLLHENRS